MQGTGIRVLIAGGGTGGHVIPALAIARELRDVHSAEVRFVGTERGLETRLVPEAGFALELMRVGQLKNVSLATRVRTVGDLPIGMVHCMALLRRFRPDVVVGVGGYASGPMMMAAILRRLPNVAFEPNAAPGLANRMVGRWVSAAAVNFAATQGYFRNPQVTGIPVRPEFFAVEPTRGPALRLLVFGGSQGARVLNEAMAGAATELLARFPELTIVHQAGGRHAESTTSAYGELMGNGRVRVQPYLDAMVDEIAAADLVLCRSGASTVAELAAAGRASVLVPFAAAADDHQRRNADVLVDAGAAAMILERDLSPERVVEVAAGLLADRSLRTRMGEAARLHAHRDATARIAEMCVRLAG